MSSDVNITERCRLLDQKDAIPFSKESTADRASGFNAILYKGGILSAVGSVTFILLLCKVMGFSEKIVVAKYLGTSQSADCYYAALSVVWMLVFIVRELVQPACLPVYVNLCRNDPPRSDRVLSALLVVLVFSLAIVSLILMMGPEAVVKLVVPGFSNEAQMETTTYLRTMTAGIVFLSIMGLTGTILNAHQRFTWAVIGDFLFRFILVSGLAIGFWWWSENLVGMFMTLGATAGLCTHVLILRKHTRWRWPRVDQETMVPLHQMMLLAAPLLVGVVFSHISDLVDGILASTLSSGRLSALNYAKKLTDAVVLLGPVALSTIMFSKFSFLVADNKLDEMRTQLIRCIRVVMVASIPVTVLIVVLRYPLVELLFQRGKFDTTSAKLTSSALACYGMGIVALALDGLLVGTFYALKDMKTPVTVGIIGVAADILLAWLLMKRFDHIGIALALTIAKTAKITALGVLLNKRLSLDFGHESFYLLVKLAIGIGGMVAGMTLLHYCGVTMVSSQGILAKMIGLCVQGGLGCFIFLGIAYILRVHEVDYMFRMICHIWLVKKQGIFLLI